MFAEKWDWSGKQYRPYRLPKGCKILITDDMEAEAVCAQCGKHLPLGQTYTSLEVHTPRGLGYPVCEGCYIEEMARRIEARYDGD